MKDIKKLMITLVALLALTAQAWAQEEITTIPNGDFETWTYDGEDMPNNWNSNATSDGSLNGIMGGKQLKRSTDVRPGSSGQYSCSIWSKSAMGVINIGILTSGRIHFGSMTSTNKENYIYSDRDGSNTKNNVTNPCAMPFTGKPTAVKVWVKYVQGGTGYGEYATAKFSAIIHGDADYVAYNLAEHDNDDNKALVVASAEQEIAYNNGEWEQLTIPFNYTDNNVDPAYILINAYTNAYPGKGKANDYLYIDDIELEYASSSSGPEVTWTAATKTGSFTMPGGNVTLEPEYYPQATAAEGAVTAATDAKATTDAPLVTIDETKLTGAKKLMYYVSTDDTAPAYDADGWTDQLPTAEGFTQQGIVYIWYYPVGTDEGDDEATATYSDGDICATALTVTIGAAPTYAVELAEGTEESDKWTVKAGTDGSFQSLPLKGVKAGTKVKLKYDGDRSMLKGVKAVKKAAAGIVNPVVGQVIGSDGKNYDANATLPDGVTAVAVIAYVGSETGDDTYKNGLAIALADESNSNWSTAKSTCEGKSAVSGAAWLLPSQKQWKTMFKANGGNEGSYSGLNTAIGTAGGTALQVNERYWSSSELDADFAWVLVLGENSAGWDGAPEDLGHQVRACLAF